MEVNLFQAETNCQVLDPRKMPREFMPRFRQPEVAGQLIEIVRRIDDVIASKQENWTWAIRLRVLPQDTALLCADK